jgi:ketosteroid isomerase-like protein
MKKRFRLLFFAFLLAACGAAMADEEADKAQLTELEKNCATALIKADIPWLSDFYAMGWIVVGPDGQQYGRQQMLAVIGTGALKWTSCEYTDFEIRVVGDTAVVIYKASAAGELRGQPIGGAEYCSDTFVRVDGHWHCVHSHNTTLP